MMNGKTTLGLLLTLCSCLVGSHPGNGIVALSNRSALTGDAINNGLWRFETGTNPIKLTGTQSFHCHWVTRGLDGNLYAETLSRRNGAWTGTVYLLDARGANPREIAKADEGVYGIFAVGRQGQIIHQGPSGIIATKAGRATAFRGSGKVARGEPALGQVSAYAWSKDDELYLSDGPYVRRVGSDGVVRLVVKVDRPVTTPLYSRTRGVADIWGLALDSEGRIYATVPANGTVLRIERDKSQHVMARSEGGWSATGVAEHSGTVFLLESKTQGSSNEGPRVRASRINGTFRVIGQAKPG